MFLTKVSPLGPLAPGNDDVARAFEAMWKEAETNRDKWGCQCIFVPLPENANITSSL
jgi:hypothetical protein